MLTSKQRALLRAQANGLEVVFQVGKGEIDETLVKTTADCLAARELIKMKVLETSAYTAREAAGYNGWSFQEFQGDPRLVQKMTTGEWEEKECLICPPHHRIEASYDGGKVCAVPCEESTAG